MGRSLEHRKSVPSVQFGHLNASAAAKIGQSSEVSFPQAVSDFGFEFTVNVASDNVDDNSQ